MVLVDEGRRVGRARCRSSSTCDDVPLLSHTQILFIVISLQGMVVSLLFGLGHFYWTEDWDMSVCVPTTFSSFTLTIYHLYWWADFVLDLVMWTRVAVAHCTKPALPKAAQVYAEDSSGLAALGLPPGATLATTPAPGGGGGAVAVVVPGSAMVLPVPIRKAPPKTKVELTQLARVVHAQAKRT